MPFYNLNLITCGHQSKKEIYRYTSFLFDNYAFATEKTFSKIRFSIEDKSINSKGFTGTCPMVADQKGKQQISVKAETTNAWTGQIETYWRTFEWCVN